MNREITPEMQAFAERVNANAAKKSRSQITEQGKSVGLAQELKAKWKIEIMFGPKRTTLGPNKIDRLSVWQSGRRLNGGGDDLAFWCIDSESGNQGCGGVFSSDNVKNGEAYCPHCKRMVNAERLTQFLSHDSMTTENLSKLLEKLFRQLDSSCDIYLKFDRYDIRTLSMEKSKGTEVANKLRGLHIYPLKNILKDTAAGASLAGRFRAFLTS